MKTKKKTQLLDDLEEARRYCYLKEETLDRILWRNLLDEAVDVS